MRRLTTGAVVLLMTTGCALTQPTTPAVTTGAPAPSASARRVTLEPSGAPSASQATLGSQAPSGSSPASASSLTPTVAPKRLDAVVLPSALGEYRAQQQVENQSATYVGNRSTADLVIVAVMRGATTSAMGPALKSAQVYGPALCGALDAEGAVGAVCTLPLDQGVILVSGSSFMKVDEVARLAGLLWEQIP